MRHTDTGLSTIIHIISESRSELEALSLWYLHIYQVPIQIPEESDPLILV